MATQMKANGRDRCRGMSAEDEMMFKLGRPFEDDVSKRAATICGESACTVFLSVVNLQYSE